MELSAIPTLFYLSWKYFFHTNAGKILYISIQVQLMVPGVPGLTGLHVPRAVEEELRPGRDCVTVQPRHTVVMTAMVITLDKNSVTLNHVS